MILDDERRQKVQEWLITYHGRIPDCSFCGKNAGQWEYLIYSPMITDRSQDFKMRPRRSTVELACPVCGFLLAFDGQKLNIQDDGVLPGGRPPSTDTTDGGSAG
jgi:hypothetical protein